MGQLPPGGAGETPRGRANRPVVPARRSVWALEKRALRPCDMRLVGRHPAASLHVRDLVALVLSAMLAVFALVVAVALYSGGAPLPVIASVAVLPILGFTRARRGINRTLEGALLARQRARIGLLAAEEERTRLARRIHDEPLQALAGTIQQLERASTADDTLTTGLRSVADQLRAIAVGLRPPILDDFGLAPAIEQLADRGRGSTPVTVSITNDTGYLREQRLPPDVEVVAFRILAEATANAVRHSGGSAIRIEGWLSPHRLAIEVIDDGVGITPAAVEAAARAGHMGIASMRARAQSIGAHLDVGPGSGRGTRIRLRWSK